MTRHDADQVLGHLQRHHTRNGTVIRYHRRSGLVLDLPEPYEHDVRRTVVEVIAGVLIMGGLFVAIVMWGAIAAVRAL